MKKICFFVVMLLLVFSVSAMADGFGAINGNLNAFGSFGDKYIATEVGTGVMNYQNTYGNYGVAESGGSALSGVEVKMTNSSALTISESRAGGYAKSLGHANAGGVQTSIAGGMSVNGLTVGGNLNVRGFGVIH